jgi:hypothetical protein
MNSNTVKVSAEVRGKVKVYSIGPELRMAGVLDTDALKDIASFVLKSARNLGFYYGWYYEENDEPVESDDIADGILEISNTVEVSQTTTFNITL